MVGQQNLDLFIGVRVPARQQNMSKIQFVYFDLGKVVFNFSGGLEEISQKTCHSFEEVEKIFLKYDDATCRGELTPQDLWNKYKVELATNINIPDFAYFWVNHFTRINETIKLLQALERAEIPKGILSNIYLGVFELITQKSIIPELTWNAKVLSSEVGCIKPEERIYQVAQQQCGVDPQNILFIDDKSDFLNPAINLGWQTHQFNYQNPAESVSKIKELLELK